VTDIKTFVVYPQGAARCVVDLDSLVEMLSPEQADYLLGVVLDRLVAEADKLRAEIDAINSVLSEETI